MSPQDPLTGPGPQAANGPDGTPQISTAWTTVQTADGPMKAYVARPQEGADRAVVVLQEAFGVNEHMQDVAQRLAREGYLALAPQLFHRTGTDVVAYDDHPQAMALIGALGPEQIVADVQGALDHLRLVEGTGPARTAVVGFCFGGRAAFTAATALPGLGAVAVFYGPGIVRGPHSVLHRAGEVTAPVLMHVGAEDPTIPAADVAAIEAAMGDARPQMYRPVAAEAAWASTREFLEHHLPRAATSPRPQEPA